MDRLDTLWIMLFLLGSATIVGLTFTTSEIFALY
jgi:hypothetical protein